MIDYKIVGRGQSECFNMIQSRQFTGLVIILVNLYFWVNLITGQTSDGKNPRWFEAWNMDGNSWDAKETL